MATLIRTPTLIIKKIHFPPVLYRKYSHIKTHNVYKNIFKTCACVFGGGLLYYAAHKHAKKDTVYALKSKVSLCSTHILKHISVCSYIITNLKFNNVNILKVRMSAQV